MRLKDLPTKYDFLKVEDGKYKEWISKGYFTAGDISKKPYTIVIPPPNITGKLHLGHVLDFTIQDILARRKRMEGYDVLYLPGMDHASIATQARVEAKLRKQGISRYDLGREEFMKVSWDWKDEHSNLIKEQWEAIGISVDYTRERFTLDEGLNEAVNHVFVKMYNEGLIYRGEKIINWDVQSKTALSNIEVDYKDIEGAYYHIMYPFVDGEGGLTVATTRPETMFGDVALMVHPKDERYKKFIGKTIYIPTTKTIIPVIADEYVDITVGTGVVKVTPAHDPNDFEVGLRHNLARPLCMEEDGTMNSLAGNYAGMERFACRKKLVSDLKESNNLVKIEKMIHSVGHSERTGVVVEPRLSLQWFVAMDKLATDLLDMQKGDGRIDFYPARFEKIFDNWLTNIQDWCISRQLWWGHRIPAWYRNDEIFVGMNAPEGEGWIQDEDALDTWFSSALWPFSTLGWPHDTDDFKRYFPTDVLTTGYDLIFFWVSRMAFQSKYLLDVRPFKDVVFHGMIRDELGRKVSKSLDNGADMMDVKAKYGMDSLRYFITTTNAMGTDIRFSEEKIEAAWNFINKIWNISRFIGLNFENANYNNEEINNSLLNTVDKWILSKLNTVIRETDEYYEKYEFSEVAKTIYKFVWNDFASWYVEMTKIIFSEDDQVQKINTCGVLNYVLTAVLKLLHPFMPFVTEEIYKMYNEGSITISDWPKVVEIYDFNDSLNIEEIYEIITAIRNVRASLNVVNSKEINVELQISNLNILNFVNDHLNYLKRFTNYKDIVVSSKELDSTNRNVTVLPNVIILIPLDELVDFEAEIIKLKENINKLNSEIDRCNGLLNNQNFVAKAPVVKIKAEEEKLASYKKQLAEVKKLLDEYEGR